MPKSDFTRNVLTLMSGTVIAQAIPISIMPILTRLYSPEDFGVLAIFIALSTILSSFASGRYELAIIICDTDLEAVNLSALCLFICLIISIITFLIFVFFGDYMALFLNNKEITLWLPFIPLVIFLTSLFNILNYLNIRYKKYSIVARANVLKSVTLVSMQLLIGFYKSGAAGLVSGQITSQMSSNIFMAFKAVKTYSLSDFDLQTTVRLAKRYINFPKYSMPAIFANALAFNANNLLISNFFSVTTLGFYSLAHRLLIMPTTLIGQSIGQVYFQEATAEKNKYGHAKKTFRATSVKLGILSLCIFTPLYFALPILFAFIFGAEWRIAGVYGQIILPFVAVQFIVSSLTTTNSIFEKQQVSLYWQLSLLFFSLSSILISYHYDFEFVLFLYLFSSILVVLYLILWCILRRVANG